MATLLDRGRQTSADSSVGRTRARAVLLATMSVRVDPAAESFALESALEAGVPLIVANMLLLPPYMTTLMLAREYATLPHEEALDELRATAERAASLGIRTELLRISSRRPLTALLELVSEREPGLLVFGPDRSQMSHRRFRAAARTIRRDAPCLVWVAD